MSDTKISSLYVAVGFEVDKADMAKVEKQTKALGERLEKSVKVKPSVSWREKRAEMQKEAMLWRSEQIKRQRIHERMAIQSQSRIARAAKRVGGFGAGLGKAAVGGLATIGAGMAVAGGVSVVSDVLDFDKALTTLDVSSRGAVGNIDKFRSRVLAVSKDTGLAKEEVLAGAQAFVTLTGDGKTAAEQMTTFSQVAIGQGAAMADVAGAAATLYEQFGIAGGDFKQGFSILSAGGKAGKIELKDISALMASLGASYKQFGGSQGTGGLATLGAAFQVAAKNFGSASETATGLESLMGSLQQHAGKLKKEKIDIFQADGKTLKPLMEIVDAIASKGFTGTKLFDLLGRKEAKLTLDALVEHRQKVDEIAKATLHARDIDEDNAKVQASSAHRVTKAWNEVKVALVEAFDPGTVKGLADALVKVIGLARDLVESFGEITDYVSELMGAGNPLHEVAADQAEESGKLEELAAGAPTGDRLKAIESALANDDYVRLTSMGVTPNEMAALEARNRLTAKNAKGRKPGGIARTLSAIGDIPETVAPSMLLDEPSRYSGDGVGSGSGVTIQSSVSLSVEAGVDSKEYEEITRRVTREENEKIARDVAAAAGQ